MNEYVFIKAKTVISNIKGSTPIVLALDTVKSILEDSFASLSTLLEDFRAM